MTELNLKLIDQHYEDPSGTVVYIPSLNMTGITTGYYYYGTTDGIPNQPDPNLQRSIQVTNLNPTYYGQLTAMFISDVLYINCIGIYGDINGDGIITSEDLSLIQQHIAGTYILSECKLSKADVDEDNIVTSNDATYIQNYINNIQPYGKTGQVFPTICQSPSCEFSII